MENKLQARCVFYLLGGSIGPLIAHVTLNRSNCNSWSATVNSDQIKSQSAIFVCKLRSNRIFQSKFWNFEQFETQNVIIA